MDFFYFRKNIETDAMLDAMRKLLESTLDSRLESATEDMKKHTSSEIRKIDKRVGDLEKKVNTQNEPQ